MKKEQLFQILLKLNKKSWKNGIKTIIGVDDDLSPVVSSFFAYNNELWGRSNHFRSNGKLLTVEEKDIKKVYKYAIRACEISKEMLNRPHNDKERKEFLKYHNNIK